MARRAAARQAAPDPSPDAVPPRPMAPVVSGGARAGGDVDALALDRLIHERMRLGIVSALAANASLTFTELRELMGTTDGNLSVHARKLEDAGYVRCTKGYEGRVPRTSFELTDTGRAALEQYLDHMEALIRAARER